MKRYVIFAAIGPFFGGFWLLLTSTMMSGYLHGASWTEIGKLIGCIAFAAAELTYGSRGPDSGLLQFVMYGLVGFIPATLSSFLAHRYADAGQEAAASA